MNVFRSLHLFVGYGIPAGFLILALWSLASLVFKREPHDWFWNLLGVLQVVIGIQFIFGAVLFLSGGRPLGAGGPVWLHYVYGAFFPALVLLVAHIRARKVPAAPWLIFGFASLICFGLTFRALQTGLS
jgi:hypothetical protein